MDDYKEYIRDMSEGITNFANLNYRAQNCLDRFSDMQKEDNQNLDSMLSITDYRNSPVFESLKKKKKTLLQGMQEIHNELNKIIDDFCALQSEQEETIEMLKDDLGSGSQQLI